MAAATLWHLANRKERGEKPRWLEVYDGKPPVRAKGVPKTAVRFRRLRNVMVHTPQEDTVTTRSRQVGRCLSGSYDRHVSQVGRCCVGADLRDSTLFDLRCKNVSAANDPGRQFHGKCAGAGTDVGDATRGLERQYLREAVDLLRHTTGSQRPIPKPDCDGETAVKEEMSAADCFLMKGETNALWACSLSSAGSSWLRHACVTRVLNILTVGTCHRVDGVPRSGHCDTDR